MQLVITTQIRENYGTIDNPYWKCKGGETYVYPNLTLKQSNKIMQEGIPTLSKLINTDGKMFQEHIIGHTVVADGASVCEDWETPWNLCFMHDVGRWLAYRVTNNDEYGYLRKEIAQKVESYYLRENGEHDEYQVKYVMRNGDNVPASEINEYLNKMAA